MTHLYSVFNFFEEITYMVLNPIKKFLIHPSCPFNDIFLLVCQNCYGNVVCLHGPENPSTSCYETICLRKNPLSSIILCILLIF